MSKKDDAPGGIFKACRALNVAEEKQKFMQNPESYNPQFRYGWSTDDSFPQSERPNCLKNFSQPSDTHLPNAIRILEQCVSEYGSYQAYEQRFGGEPHTRTIVETGRL